MAAIVPAVASLASKVIVFDATISPLARRGPERGKERASFSKVLGPSLDLEIIAQRNADEKDAGDREEILRDHQELKAFWGNGRAFVGNFARAE